jgi:hypothetical protein
MGGDSNTEAPRSPALRAGQKARGDACGDAADAVRALRLALHAARIKLPDLQADGCPCGDVAARPLVELGHVRPDVALELAELISEGAMHAAVRAADAHSRGDDL